MLTPVNAPKTRRRVIQAIAAATMLTGIACSNGRMILTEQDDARRLVTQIAGEFARANEAANRAVMADTDERSAAAAAEAAQATAAVDKGVSELAQLLRSLNYPDDAAILKSFSNAFAEFKTLDTAILSLAVENTNLKAQRLAFTSGGDAAVAFAAAVKQAAAGLPPGSPAHAAASAATIAVLDVQVLQPRHIAEADETAMDAMEAKMKVAEATARAELARLAAAAPKAGPATTEAAAALDRFFAVNREVVEFSRRNTNVRSLALTFGRKRVVAAQCADHLRQLQEALAGHTFKATR